MWQNLHVLSTLTHSTLAMDSIDSSAHSEDLSVIAVTSTQHQASGLIANSGAHNITPLHILSGADQSKGETHIKQSQGNGINMVTHLPKDMHSLQRQIDIISPKTSKHQLHSTLMKFPQPQNQVRFTIGGDLYSHQSVKDLVRVSWPQSPARSGTSYQITKASIHTPSPKALIDPASNRDSFTQERSQESANIHLFQPRGPNQDHQLASASVATSHTQPQIEPQQMPESNDRQLYQMLLDIRPSAQPLVGPYQNEGPHKPDVPRIPSNMYSFEPQIGSYRNQQAYNRQWPHMAIDGLWSQHDIHHQKSQNGQMARFSMEEPLLQSQFGFPDIREAQDRQLARISLNPSHCQPEIEFPQLCEGPICEVDRKTMNTPLNGAQSHIPQNRDIHNRQLNHALKSMHQPRNRTEPPQTIEALNRQMALFATRDVHNDWQNGLQAGSRPAFWDQCRQNFGISQHVQPEPSAGNMPSDFCTSTTMLPQLHLEPGYFCSQQVDALQGWHSSYNKGARFEPLLSLPFPPTPDNPLQAVLQPKASRAAYQSIHDEARLYQPPVLPATISVDQPGPAAMHVLPPGLKVPEFLSKSKLSSEGLYKATSDNLYAARQPPIGTPRASGPKLITAALERSTGQGQTTDIESNLSSLPYYPGSDVMYPYAKENPSEALRLLTADGHPSIDKLLDKDVVPFTKCDDKSGTLDWGVIRIGNVSTPFRCLLPSC